jgi:diguanylate cyclase (GGDEF)-like protein/PAS domain S-box-containing protein
MESFDLDLKAVLDNLPSLVGYWDKDQRNVYSNLAYLEWFGMRPEDIRGLHMKELQGQLLYEKNRPYVEGALRGERQHFERTLPRLDGGGVRHAVVEYLPNRVDGEVVGFYAIVSDITPIIEAQQDQQERQEILSGLYNLSPIGITLTDLNGHYIDFNQMFCDMLGYSREELARETLWSLTPGEYEAEDVAQLDQLWQTRRYGPYQKKLKHKDGHLLPVQVSGMIVSQRDGQHRVWSLVENIEPHIQTLTSIQTLKDRYQKLYEAMPDSVMLISATGAVVGFNQRAVEKYGYTAEELHQVSIPDLEVLEDPEMVARHRKNILESGHDHFRTVHRLKDGRQIHVEADVSVVDLGEGEPVFQCVFHDITDTIQRETVLEQSKERFQLAIDCAEEAIWDWDLESDTLVTSPLWCRLMGYAEGELPAYISSWELLCHPDDWSILQARLDAHLLGKSEKFEFEHRARHRDGHWVWLLSRATVIRRDASGVPLRMVGTNVDISVRKMVEERLALALDAAEEGLWDWNLETGELVTSARWSEMLGYLHGEIPADIAAWEPLCHPDDLGEVHRRLGLLFSGESSRYEFEHRLRHKDGHWVWVQGRAKVVKRDDAGNPLRVVGTNADISARKLIEQQLALDSEILANVTDSVFVLDRQGRIMYANEVAWQSRGYSREELMAMDLRALNTDAANTLLAGRLARLFADGHIRLESEHRCKDGRVMPVEVSSKTFEFNGQPAILSVIRDITERKQAESALKASESRAQEQADLLNAIMESSPDVIVFALDREYRYLAFNSKHRATMLAIWGKDIALGMSMLDVIGDHPDRAGARRCMDRALAGESFVDESAYGDAAWSRRFWQTFWAPMKSGDGEVVGVASIVLDISERKRFELSLDEKEARLRAILDNIPYLAWFKDADGRFVSVNEPYIRSTGLASAEEIVGKTDFDLWPHELADKYVRDDLEVMSERKQRLVEERSLDQGEERWVETFKTPIISERGEVLGTTGLARDITSRKRTEESLQIAGLVYQSSAEAMMVTDEDNRIININPAFTTITGYVFEDVAGRNPRIFKSGVHDLAFYRELWDAIHQHGYWSGEIWDKKKGGELYAKHLTINAIRNASGHIYRYVALFSDITAKKRSDELIWQQANIDPLTSLPNRRLFQDRLTQVMLRAHRDQQPFTLLFIDLDRFKQINDTLGHDAGDQLLIEAAERIRHCVREADTIARLGGDEFTIILPETGEPPIIERIAQDLIRALGQPFLLGAEQGYISASIGIAVYPQDGQDVETLVRHADQAMYAAKDAGRNGYSYFISSMQQEVERRFSLANELRRALQNGEFEVYYQPIVEIATGKTHKAEALLRWRHPVRGLVQPAEFIPIAEETGLIHPIGDFVFRRAARFATRLAEWGHPVQISVNKSPSQFTQRIDGLDWLNYLFEQHTPAELITVEITEGLMLHPDASILKRLDEFREAGVEVSIDDFGTGFSSLSYLKKFHIDYLKIDQSFVANLAYDPNDLAMIEAIVAMAHKLGIKTIAEGVETEAQFDILKACGCDFAQGFRFAEALPEEMFEGWLDGQRA